MNKIYTVRTERGNRMDAWSYQVVASDGIQASKKALRQTIKDSGVKTGWRIVNLSEQEGYVIK